MVSHNRELGGKKADAREWTAEIEAATNVEVAARERAEAGNGEEAVRGQAEAGAEVARAEGQGLGRKVIASGATERGRKGKGEREAGRELKRDERELTEAEDFVGEESSQQVGERLADDREDLMTEMGQGLALENRVMAKTQEGVAKVVAPKVEQMVGQTSYRPADLMRLYRQGVNETLRVFNRRIGDRN